MKPPVSLKSPSLTEIVPIRLHTGLEQARCLNGPWDFHPGAEDGPVPETGWVTGTYQVPSFWMIPFDAVRTDPEDSFKPLMRDDVSQTSWKFPENAECLFDAFGYPKSWSAQRSAWIRRTVEIGSLAAHRRLHLVLEGVEPQVVAFVNGVEVGTSIHPTLPLTCDITGAVKPGTNEITLKVTDYPRSETGRALVPMGSWVVAHNSGVWQDTWLVERDAARVDAVAITTSVRNGTLTLDYDLVNHTESEAQVTLHARVVPARKGAAPDLKATPLLDLPERVVTIPAGGRLSQRLEAPWPEAPRWQPEDPNLCHLITELKGGPWSDVHVERFGFREVWLDGPDLMLNGHPIHLFSDWGHKTTAFQYTEGWIRQWFAMLRAGNMNHSRLHTHPHPKRILEIADEEGILITGETGLHGSGGGCAGEDERFWVHARDHVARFLARDRNHPCILLWSTENEMRWNRDPDGGARTRKELPALRQYMKTLDPTRPVYHEGDSSLWNEGDQDLLSRHYGKECAGTGWWDRKQPLHSGEMSLYHYAGPNNTLSLLGDQAFLDQRHVSEAAAEDTRLIVEAGRVRGVSCFGPWNLSCLENLRLHGPETFTWDDPGAPGVKPLRAEAMASEFEFWKPGPGFHPGFSFDLQARAFRPLAVIDLSLEGDVTGGGTLRKTFHVVNDLPRAVHGRLTVTWMDRGHRNHFLERRSLTVARGRVLEADFEIPLPQVREVETHRLHVCFHEEGMPVDRRTSREPAAPFRHVRPKGRFGDGFDWWEVDLRVHPAVAAEEPLLEGRTIGTIGSGRLDQALTAAGLKAHALSPDHPIPPDLTAIVVQRDGMDGPRWQNRLIPWVQAGGRLLISEQEESPFPALQVHGFPTQTAFIRASHHPVFSGLDEGLFRFWGRTPYTEMGGENDLARFTWRKGGGEFFETLLDTGDGQFGGGDLGHALVWESRVGSGLILASQLRLGELWDRHPVANLLFTRMLRHVLSNDSGDIAPTASGPWTADPNRSIRNTMDLVKEGRQVLVPLRDGKDLTPWLDALGLKGGMVALTACHQAKMHPDPRLWRGISQEDWCGIETWTYCPADKRNVVVARWGLDIPSARILLSTSATSLLTELFANGGRTEPLRAHTVSRYRVAASPGEVPIMVAVAHGRGEILFSTWNPDETRERFTRATVQLSRNLGERGFKNPLEGTFPEGPRLGTTPGWPSSIYVCDRHPTPGERPRWLSATLFRHERMLNRPLVEMAPFHPTPCPEGIVILPGEETALYLPLFSPVPRKNLLTNLGVPNPEAYTFLELTGEGATQIYVNGRDLGTHDTTGGAVIGDIELEGAWNHVLLFHAGKGPLRLRWRNILRQPERGFRYGVEGA